MPQAKPAAPISVTDRTGLNELAAALNVSGYRMVATTGTAEALRKLGYAVEEIEQLTGFAQLLGGRVKTLHPKIFGAILAQPELPAHASDLEAHDIPLIDVVVVNLYPFESTVSDSAAEAEVIEQIDIGGVALLRAAAKNHQRVSVIVSPSQYEELAAALIAGGPTVKQRRVWARTAFATISRYDSAIAGYFSSDGLTLADSLNWSLPLQSQLRYGENPWQRAAFYRAPDKLHFPKQLSGKMLSYNNLLDLDSCLRLLAPIELPQGFPERAPAISPMRAAIVKHTVPCGLAAARSAFQALTATLGADPISAFCGIVAVDAEVDKESAELLKSRFLEIIAAPSFSAEALPLLQAKKNLRLLVFDRRLPANLESQTTLRSALGGVLVEHPNPESSPDTWTVVTERQPEPDQWRDLLFAFGAVRQVKSNAAVVARGEVTLGICGGQTNRVAAVELACKRSGAAAKGAVLATDGFFPFADGIEAAAAAGIAAVVAPSGSIRDAEVVAAGKRANLCLVFTSRRYFLH